MEKDEQTQTGLFQEESTDESTRSQALTVISPEAKGETQTALFRNDSTEESTSTQALAVISPEDSKILNDFEKMSDYIQKCDSVSKVKTIHDQALALEFYYRRARNLQDEKRCARIRLRSERRMGQLLIEMHRDGLRRGRGGDQRAKLDKQTLLRLSDLKVTKFQSYYWRDLARIPQKKFEEYLGTDVHISTTGVFKSVRLRHGGGYSVGMDAFYGGEGDFLNDDPEPIPYKTLKVHFRNAEDMEKFGYRFGPKVKHIWFRPELFDLAAKMRKYPVPADGRPQAEEIQGGKQQQ